MENPYSVQSCSCILGEEKAMKKKKWTIRALGIALTLAVVFGCAGFIMPSERVEPDSPWKPVQERLRVETLENGTGSGQSAEEDESQGDSSRGGNQNLDQIDRYADTSKNRAEELPPGKDELDTKEQDEADQQSETDQAKDGQNDQKTEETDGGSGDSKGGGEDDAKGDKPSDSGEKPDQQPDEPGADPNPDEEAHLVTDLKNGIITFSQLKNDTLKFYAYYSDRSVNANIKVNYRHDEDPGNGKTLAANGVNYSAVLKKGINYITVSYTDINGKRKSVRFTIDYQAEKATEENPEVGEHPPIIKTNLDGRDPEIDMIRTANFTLTVDATTWQGNRIYANGIQVRMKSLDTNSGWQTITNPTGNQIFEYVLHFERPNRGDIARYAVQVLAWDGDGNSKLVTYEVHWYAADEGEVIGRVHAVIDATSVGLGILAEDDVDIRQGESAASSVVEILDYFGFTCEYGGTIKNGFYLRRISRGDAFDGAEIPDDEDSVSLLECLKRDGIGFTKPCSRDSLGENDFTRSSGWMYALNDKFYYPGKGLSEWTLEDGDTLYIRYTLAEGKDIGTTSSHAGIYSSYCGIWANDRFTEVPDNHDLEEVDRQEATADADGYIEYTCKKCGMTKREVIPAIGEHEHDYQETDRVEPTETEDGYIEYTCSICGETKRETLPATGKTDPDQPDPGNPDKPDPDNPDPDPDPGEPDKPDPDNPDPGEPDKPDPGEPDKPDPDPDPEPDPGSDESGSNGGEDAGGEDSE